MSVALVVASPYRLPRHETRRRENERHRHGHRHGHRHRQSSWRRRRGCWALGAQEKSDVGGGSNKGFGILEWAGLIPQSVVVKSSKFAWKEAWKTMTRELAPQAPDGTYTR